MWYIYLQEVYLWVKSPFMTYKSCSWNEVRFLVFLLFFYLESNNLSNSISLIFLLASNISFRHHLLHNISILFSVLAILRSIFATTFGSEPLTIDALDLSVIILVISAREVDVWCYNLTRFLALRYGVWSALTESGFVPSCLDSSNARYWPYRSCANQTNSLGCD